MKIVTGGVTAAKGFFANGIHCGVRKNRTKRDVVKECINRGVLCLTAKDKVRLLPALNIDTDTLKKAITIIKEVCYELKK